MRLTMLAIALAGACSAPFLAGPAKAQAGGAWFFCYVDPPTFNRGTYVYTQVNYIGSAVIPQHEILAAMARAEPQASSRQPSCWRYESQAEAEQRRQQGMAGDRSAGFAVREIAWTSPYSPPPPSEIAEPALAAVPEAPAAPVSTPAASVSAATAAPVAPAAPASSAAASPAGSVAATPARPRMTKAEAEADYQRRLAAYEVKRAEHARQQAQYLQAVQAEATRMEDATSRAQQELNRYKQQRAQWEADVAACKAGDHSKCASSTEAPASPQ